MRKSRRTLFFLLSCSIIVFSIYLANLGKVERSGEKPCLQLAPYLGHVYVVFHQGDLLWKQAEIQQVLLETYDIRHTT